VANPHRACTAACTSEAKNENALTVEALAAAMLTLSQKDRARLAALLNGQQPAPEGRIGEGRATTAAQSAR
jgi:hypothetical protein